MEQSAVAGAATFVLSYFLPFLLADPPREQDAIDLHGQANWDTAVQLWEILHPALENIPNVLKAAHIMAYDPTEERASLALRMNLEKLFSNEPSLMEQTIHILQKSSYGRMIESEETAQEAEAKYDNDLAKSSLSKLTTVRKFRSQKAWLTLAILLLSGLSRAVLRTESLPSWLILISVVLLMVGRGVIVTIIAEKLNIKRSDSRWLGVIAALLSGWIAWLIIMMHRPSTNGQKDELTFSPIVRALAGIFNLIPFALFSILFITNTDYIFLLFQHDLGFLIFTFILIIFTFITAILYPVWAKGFTSRQRFILVMVIAILLYPVLLWLILLGPATIQIIQTFGSTG